MSTVGTLHTLLSMNQGIELLQYYFTDVCSDWGLNMVCYVDPFTGDSALRLIGEISATAANLNVESWNWNDPMLSKAFLSTIEEKVQSKDELQQIAAMDAIAAFASSSEKGLYGGLFVCVLLRC
jgi:hypothetical protein